jgi:hypothetical protein
MDAWDGATAGLAFHRIADANQPVLGVDMQKNAAASPKMV